MNAPKIFCLSLVLVIAPFAAAQIPCGPTIVPKATLVVNWAQLAFDAGHTACNPYESILSPTTVEKLTEEWLHLTEGGPFAPVVANGIVYSSDSSGTLIAMNASTGAPLWSYQPDSGGTWGTSPAVANGVLYLGFYDGLGMAGGLYAFNASNGFPLWTYPVSAAVSPTFANGVIYAFESSLTALNASTGEPIWTSAISGADYSVPAVANNAVFAGSYDGNVYAVNAATGATLWQTQIGHNPFVGSVANNIVYVGTTNYPSDALYALNASTGAVLWQFNSAGPIGATAVATGLVYVATGPDDGNLYALNASTGTLVWKFALGGGYVNVQSYLAVANGVVYFSSSGVGENTDLYAVDAKTGAYLWDYPNFDTITPVVADGKVYVGQRGGVAAFHLPGQ